MPPTIYFTPLTFRKALRTLEKMPRTIGKPPLVRGKARLPIWFMPPTLALMPRTFCSRCGDHLHYGLDHSPDAADLLLNAAGTWLDGADLLLNAAGYFA